MALKIKKAMSLGQVGGGRATAPLLVPATLTLLHLVPFGTVRPVPVVQATVPCP